MLIKLKIWQNLQKLCRQRYNHCSPGSSPVASEFASDALQDIFLRTFLASYFVSYFSIFLTEKKKNKSSTSISQQLVAINEVYFDGGINPIMINIA